jgi:hypothetical protein
MIARLHIVVPFNMVIPVAVEFKLYTYEDDGYDVTGIVPDHWLVGTRWRKHPQPGSGRAVVERASIGEEGVCDAAEICAPQSARSRSVAP